MYKLGFFTPVPFDAPSFGQQIYKECLEGQNPITTLKMAKVFAKYFPENEALNHSLSFLETDSETSNRKKHKMTLKTNMASLIKSRLSNQWKQILLDMNEFPRFFEAQYAIDKGVKPEMILGRGRTHEVYILYDRTQTKPLGVFKDCNDYVKKKELEVSQRLAKNYGMNVKKTKEMKTTINEKRCQGIFQKYIVGKDISELKEPTEEEAVDQIQRIAIFDLLNKNSDRNEGNIRVDSKRIVWALDHDAICNNKTAYHDRRLPVFNLTALKQQCTQQVTQLIKSLSFEDHVSLIIQNDNTNNSDRVISETKNTIQFLKWAVLEKGLTLFQVYKIGRDKGSLPPHPKYYEKSLQVCNFVINDIESLSRYYPIFKGGDKDFLEMVIKEKLYEDICHPFPDWDKLQTT